MRHMHAGRERLYFVIISGFFGAGAGATGEIAKVSQALQTTVKLDGNSYSLPREAIRDSLVMPSGKCPFKRGCAEILFYHMGH